MLKIAKCPDSLILSEADFNLKLTSTGLIRVAQVLIHLSLHKFGYFCVEKFTFSI